MACADDLKAAKSALHLLLTGRQVTSVRYEGRSVEYSQANIGDLRAYIAELESECGDSIGRPSRGPPFTVEW